MSFFKIGVVTMSEEIPQYNKALELPGLAVRVEALEYHPELPAEADRPFPFVYFIRIVNDSQHTVTFRARKWVVTDKHGDRIVVEGEGIVGKKPTLRPGEEFEYNSYHIIGTDSVATGSYHGVDDQGRHVFVRIPPFKLTVPADE